MKRPWGIQAVGSSFTSSPFPVRFHRATNLRGYCFGPSVAQFQMPFAALKSARPAIVVFLTALALCLNAGCVGGSNESTTITVFAAASLTDAFRDIAEEFESEHPDVDVKLNFAGSQRLRSQLELGAGADVFASADESQMLLAQQAGLTGGNVEHFASTSMAVIVTKDSNITNLKDLGHPEIKVVLAHESVPAGVYARQLLHLLSSADTGLGEDYTDRVLANVVSEETSVKVVEQKVVLGEADAGIVYRPGSHTATATGSVRVLPLPSQADKVRALYPIAVLKDSDSPELAARFIDLILSRQGQGILAGYGFDAP